MRDIQNQINKATACATIFDRIPRWKFNGIENGIKGQDCDLVAITCEARREYAALVAYYKAGEKLLEKITPSNCNGATAFAVIEIYNLREAGDTLAVVRKGAK